MALSGQRYSSRQVATALRAAGIPVSRDDIDLLYLYAGSLQGRDSTQKMTITGMIDFLADTFLANHKLSGLVGDDASASLAQARQMLDDNIGQLRSERSSMAAIVSDYEVESQRTFNFIDRVDGLAAENLSGEHYLIGESVMFKELKESFPSELLLLTILTILSIFVIVAATFRSLIIPVPLILTVLSGVYFNVFASGLGGNTMFFMAYLIVQSILMGAIIDYSILMTNYYLDSRRSGNGRREAIADAYKGSGHSIMTSGLIIVLTPMLMYLTIDDPMIAMILKSLSIGALAAILIILLVLPAVLALLDRLIVKKGSRSVHIP